MNMCMKLDSNNNIIKINSERQENNVIYDYFKIENQKKISNDEKEKGFNMNKQKSIMNNSKNSTINNGLKNVILLSSNKEINKNLNNNDSNSNNDKKILEYPFNNDELISFKKTNKEKVIFYDNLEQSIN